MLPVLGVFCFGFPTVYKIKKIRGQGTLLSLRQGKRGGDRGGYDSYLVMSHIWFVWEGWVSSDLLRHQCPNLFVEEIRWLKYWAPCGGPTHIFISFRYNETRSDFLKNIMFLKKILFSIASVHLKMVSSL